MRTSWRSLLIVLAVLAAGCTRTEGRFNMSGYEVKEVRPGLTCVFTNGDDAGVSCVQGSYAGKE